MPNVELPEGLTVSDLECVMLDVPPMDIQKAVGDLWDPNALFYGTTPELKYAQGAVAEDIAHLTLMFGLHPSEVYELSVLEILGDWEIPDILINKVSFFPSRQEGQNYICVYAEVVPTTELLKAREQLENLKFTNQFSEYKPHITLVYLKTDADVDTQAWIDRLNEAFAHRFIMRENVSLNLGKD